MQCVHIYHTYRFGVEGLKPFEGNEYRHDSSQVYAEVIIACLAWPLPCSYYAPPRQLSPVSVNRVELPLPTACDSDYTKQCRKQIIEMPTVLVSAVNAEVSCAFAIPLLNCALLHNSFRATPKLCLQQFVPSQSVEYPVIILCLHKSI